MAVIVWEADQPVDQGCPVLNRTRTIVGQVGICDARLRWTVRNVTGLPVNLDDVAGSASGDSVSADSLTAAVRFADPCGEALVAEVDAEIVDGNDGVVEFQLPDAVCRTPGLYRMSVAAFEQDSIVAVDNGLLSLEPNLWTTREESPTIPKAGTPTFGEIRTLLRDYAQTNLLLRQHEFSVDEMLSAIGWSVMDWNEQPPFVRRYTCRTFPWRRAWLDGVAFQLLEMSSHAFARNDAKGPSELLVNDQAKMGEYMTLAQLHFQRWREFCKRKKIEIQSGFATIG